MTGRTASAPGKAVICGEFAVLRGAPAVSMAVDRRAVVTTSPAEGDLFVVTAPGHAEGRWRFHAASAGALSWRDELPAGGLPLVEAVVAELGDLPESPVLIEIDTRGFADPHCGRKLGLGSSAAAATALVAALSPGMQAGDVFRHATPAHRRMQGGEGSGVDVATACHGGAVIYRQDDGYPPVPADWPAGLHYRFVWSGRPARTTDAIRRARDVGARDWAALVAAAGAAESAFRAGPAAMVAAAMADWVAALRRFDSAGDVGIFAGGHAKMADLAMRCDVTYKPCGAGGGDIGVALAADIADIETFCRRAADAGFQPLDLARDERGVSERSGEAA